MAPPLDLDADDATGAAVDEADHDVAESAPAPSLLVRVRVLTLAALGPLITGYAAVAALLALVTAIAARAHFSTEGVLAAALPAWLGAHQVPVSIANLEFGVLPLLPTIGMIVIAARAAAGAAERLGLDRPGQAGQVIAAIAGAHAVCGLVIALVCADGQVTADPLAALYYPALVAALAATLGVARRCGLIDAVLGKADHVAGAGLRAGLQAVALLLFAGAAVLSVSLLISVPTVKELFALNAPGPGSAVGMLMLSGGYLPNAVVAATSFMAGPGFSLGAVALSPVEFTGGPVPGLPLLAALPEEQAPWWPVLFVLPIMVGVVVGRRLRNVDDEPVARLRAVAVAAGVVAVVFVILGGSAGGRLGVGAFDPVSMRAAALSVALVCWIVLPAAITTWFGGPRPARERMPGLIDDDHDEIDDADGEIAVADSEIAVADDEIDDVDDENDDLDVENRDLDVENRDLDGEGEAAGKPDVPGQRAVVEKSAPADLPGQRASAVADDESGEAAQPAKDEVTGSGQ